MSTVNHEPNFGAPQTITGANMIGQAAPTGIQPPQYTPEQIAQFQQMQQVQQQAVAQTAIPQVGGVPGMVGVSEVGVSQAPGQAPAPANQPAPQGMPPLNIPGQMPQQQLPTIQDNNPIAELPQNGAAPVGMTPVQNPEVTSMGQYNPMGAAGMQQNQVNQPMQQQIMQEVQQGYGYQQHAPAQQQYNPAMQQQAQQAQPQYNQMMQQQAPIQGMPGQQGYMQPQMQAPGASNQSYLQQQGGMFGPTPTGHPEKTKFQGQAILVHVTNRVTSKGNLMTTGLFNPNPGNRNEAAKSFVCFSGSAANQIEILNNPVIKAQYTQLPQAKGQTIYYEGSWEWDDRAKTPGWKCMMDNFVFVNDQNLRNLAESFVPPVPPSPMDMLNGGNMGMGNMGMQQQAPMGGMHQQNFGAPVGMQNQQPQYGQPMPGIPGMQQQAPMGGQYNPYAAQGQQPMPGMQQQAPMGGMPPMPGMQQ